MSENFPIQSTNTLPHCNTHCNTHCSLRYITLTYHPPSTPWVKNPKHNLKTMIIPPSPHQHPRLIWMIHGTRGLSHGTHMNESRHICHITYGWVTSHMDEPWHSREWVTSHMDESRHIWMSHVTYGWATSHMDESWHSCEWVTSHMDESRHEWMSHGTHMDESRHIWMSTSHMNESQHIWICHVTYGWVMAIIWTMLNPHAPLISGTIRSIICHTHTHTHTHTRTSTYKHTHRHIHTWALISFFMGSRDALFKSHVAHICMGHVTHVRSRCVNKSCHARVQMSHGAQASNVMPHARHFSNTLHSWYMNESWHTLIAPTQSIQHAPFSSCISKCARACVCVWKRERERERESVCVCVCVYT